MKTVSMFLVLVFFLSASCPQVAPNLPVTEILPASRSFLMGFSPWPYDATQEAVDWTYQTIQENGDIISHHMEEGVPWPQALSGDPFPQDFQNEINGRVNRFTGEEKILLQISPLNMNRDGLADLRSDQVNVSLPEPWLGYGFGHEEVRTAYLNYARQMIEAFSPDYLLLGVEVNILANRSPDDWPQYVSLHQYLYITLKDEYTNLDMGVSVIAPAFFPQWAPEYDLDNQMSALSDLEPYLDFLAFSVHPFMSSLLANSFPDTYFTDLFALTDLPVAVAESSYPSQVWSDGSLQWNGSQEKSRDFLRKMLWSSQEASAYFVIWFSPADFDALWSGVMIEDPVALIWRDTGLWDEEQNPRLPAHTWMAWENLPLE